MPELIASGQLPLYDYNDAIIAGAAPVNPSPDTLWLDSSVTPNMMKRWDGLAWEPVGELDPTYSETITAIETTLANMADDGLLDYSDRQKLKEDIALITGAIPADTGTLPTGATLDGGTVGSYRRLRKAAISAGMLTSNAAYTALATAYTTLSTFLNARTPKPWDVSLTNKAIPTPVDKATFRNAWLGYYNAEAALADETTATLSSGISGAQETADNIQVGGRNWFKKTTGVGGLSGTSSTVKNALNGFNTTVSTANSSIRIPNVFNENGTYTFSGYITCTVSGTVQVAFTGTSLGSFLFSATKTKFSVTGKISNYTAATYHFIDLSELSAGTYTFEDVKVEKGNRATDWSPALEDINDQIAASNTNINNLRQSLDSKRDIRLGMKLGFSGFSTVNNNYIYFCGLGTNATTFAEELSDTNGSLYDRGTQTTLVVPKQAVNLTGVASGTKGYLVWNTSDGTNKIWFITLQNTYDANGMMTASKWIKRNIGAAGDNTEMILTDAVYVLGELEI